MNAAETERRVRALAAAADLPQGFDTWSAVQTRLPQIRRRRTAVRAATAAVAALAVAAGVVIPLAVSAPASAVAAARRAAAVVRTGAGLPPFELTQVTATAAPAGFQPEPPPPRVTEYLSYADPSHWRDESIITEPFHEGTQAVTQIRNGPLIASAAAGRVTITRAARRPALPFAAPVAWQQVILHKLGAAASAVRCAPSVSLAGNGPLIDRRPTVILRVGPSPCPSADFPQANGPATFWLDRQTFLILRAVLHGPGGRPAETIKVTSLRYHVTFPTGTFRIPKPAPTSMTCPAAISLPDVAALSRQLAYPPLIPSSLPDGWRIGAIGSSGATASRCKITTFTITYRDAAGHPVVQLYEAPQASPSVRFPGKAVTIRRGLTGTLSSGSGMTILWWIQDGRYCSLQSGGLTAGVRLVMAPAAVLIHMAASLRG